MVKLFCVVVGEGSPFPVVIDAEKTVGILKKMIKDEKQDIITFDADKLDLYRVDGLTQDEDEQFVYKGTTIDMTTCSLDFFGEDKAKMPPLSLISERFNAAEMNTRWKIHVLVVVPEGAVSDHTLQAQYVEFQRAGDRLISRFESKMEALTSNLLHKSDKSYTDGALGQLECARLKKRELIIDVAPIHDEEAFWSPIIQQQADAITNEAVFDAFITPF
ncbi:hypothetical protein As57867_004868, partial [Aphanomyces stellatus]